MYKEGFRTCLSKDNGVFSLCRYLPTTNKETVKNNILLFLLVLLPMVTSCVDEYEVAEEDSYLEIQVMGTRAAINENDDPDNIVDKVRVLAFDNSNICVSNKLYPLGSGLDTDGRIKHIIESGSYKFVFVANEPRSLAGVITYAELAQMTFSASDFDSDKPIPMINDGDYTFTVSAANKNQEQVVHLKRLGVRLEFTFQSVMDLSDDFTGLHLTNLPTLVPLFPALYTGTIPRSITPRKFEDLTKGAIFEEVTSPGEGYAWAMKVKRLIIPANELKTADIEDVTKAVGFTVKLTTKGDRSALLKPEKLKNSNPEVRWDNYSLPQNGALELLGTITESQLNIDAADWDTGSADWTIGGDKILNVSHTEVNMTHLNGVRVTFYSNMPNVKVEDLVQKAGKAAPDSTNHIFNCLAVDNKNPNPYRFHYDPDTGAGYMDLLLDGGSPSTTWNSGTYSGTYDLILSAEEGSTVVKRTIKVTVEQNGLLLRFNPDGHTIPYYGGAFFKHDQKGERVITGQFAIGYSWSVTVPDEYKNWLTVSATPSFDPHLGTDTPGDAENYPVTTNSFKDENGLELKGLTGRIYFRIGVKNTANYVGTEDAKPKYGYVNLKFQGNAAGSWNPTLLIYVRQGEAADYVYSTSDPIPTTVMSGGWRDHNNMTSSVPLALRPLTERTTVAKISPYNLTTQNILKSNADYDDVSIQGADFVEYPSQAGAFFQWALNVNNTSHESYYRRAYNSSRSAANGTFIKDTSDGSNAFPILWDGGTIDYTAQGGGLYENIDPYKKSFEVCPDGYRRPTDGVTDTITHNGYYIFPGKKTKNCNNEIKDSELRTSLFRVPFSGNASSNADYATIFGTDQGTYPYVTPTPANTQDKINPRKRLRGTYLSLYADGFFDRRPIAETTTNAFGVSLSNGQAAYMGVLYYNMDRYTSIFLPAAGRLENTSGILSSAGSTGFYWSSSVGPRYEGDEYKSGTTSNRTIRFGTWALESNYNAHTFKSSYAGFGYSIRCVKDEPKTLP